MGLDEAGFESRAGTSESRYPSALYSERAYLKTRRFIIHALSEPVHGFEKDVDLLYRGHNKTGPCLLARAIWSSIKVVRLSQSNTNNDEGGISCQSKEKIFSLGALAPLRRHIEDLLGRMSKEDGMLAEELRELLRDANREPSSDLLNVLGEQ